MGQSASKSVRDAVQRSANRVAASAAKQSEKGVAVRPTPEQIADPRAANPSSFLRGEGPKIVQDVQQEMFIKHVRKLDEKRVEKADMKMPDELLKFIQDIGPLDKTLDRERTDPRLLSEQEESQSAVAADTRKSRRRRVRMPLISGEDQYTTSRTTNYTHRDPQKEEFGISNLQLFHLLRHESADDEESIKTVIQMSGEAEGMPIEKRRQLLEQTRRWLEVPLLYKDSEKNFLGVYEADRPGDDVRNVESVPKDKLKLVLEDVIDSEASKRSEVSRRSRERRERRSSN